MQMEARKSVRGTPVKTPPLLPGEPASNRLTTHPPMPKATGIVPDPKPVVGGDITFYEQP
jgi:hypothetical protein